MAHALKESKLQVILNEIPAFSERQRFLFFLASVIISTVGLPEPLLGFCCCCPLLHDLINKAARETLGVKWSALLWIALLVLLHFERSPVISVM